MTKHPKPRKFGDMKIEIEIEIEIALFAKIAENIKIVFLRQYFQELIGTVSGGNLYH